MSSVVNRRYDAPLKVPKGSELVADRVRSAILSGNLVEGAPLLPEKALMAQLGVSRATLREGLRLLEAEGLIRTRAGRGGGAKVCHPGNGLHTQSLQTVLRLKGVTFVEIMDARRLIEPVCVRGAVARLTHEQIETLRRTVEALAASMEDQARFLDSLTAFHSLVAINSGNPVLSLFAQSLIEIADPHLRAIDFPADDRVDCLRRCR